METSPSPSVPSLEETAEEDESVLPPHRRVSLVNRAFVRSAADCSFANVALTLCSNAAYGSGSAGGGGGDSGGFAI